MSYSPCGVSDSEMMCAAGDHDRKQFRGKTRDTYVCKNCGKKWWYPLRYSRRQIMNSYKSDMMKRFNNIKRLMNQWNVDKDPLYVSHNFEYLVLEAESLLEDTKYTKHELFDKQLSCIKKGCIARAQIFRVKLCDGGEDIKVSPRCEYHMEQKVREDDMIVDYYWEKEDNE